MGAARPQMFSSFIRYNMCYICKLLNTNSGRTYKCGCDKKTCLQHSRRCDDCDNNKCILCSFECEGCNCRYCNDCDNKSIISNGMMLCSGCVVVCFVCTKEVYDRHAHQCPKCCCVVCKDCDKTKYKRYTDICKDCENL